MEYLLLLPPMPALAGFVVLALAPAYLTRREVLAIGVLAGVAPAFLTIPVIAACWNLGCGVAPIFTLEVGPADVAMALGFDPLAAVGAVTVSLTGAMVLLYSYDYMAAAYTPDLRRFFALMNLFMASMLAMVLAADSIVFFLGWELMGLCSFFLIGYHVTTPRATNAGRKAFVMTRIADAMLLAALLILFLEAGSVRLAELIPAGVAMQPDWKRALVTFLLLGGALGKSAQLPFQTWLPTAMAGPTPVSALLHSATMVAAGVFLLARFSPMLASAPEIETATALFGAATALFGAVTAVAQTDVKRLLAYSSISQIGFMMMALGMGAPEAAMAHFVIHAAFKSLLFMAAGEMARAVRGATAVVALRGAVWRRPLAFWTFAAGAASLAGLPIVTAGWFSKEAVLGAAWSGGAFGQAVWAVGLAAAVCTGIYAFRPVITAALPARGGRMVFGHPAVWLPMLLLAGAAIGGGAAVDPLIEFLGAEPRHPDRIAEMIAAGAPILGAALAAVAVLVAPVRRRLVHARKIRNGWRVDARYHVLFTKPYRRVVHALIDRSDEHGDPLGRLPVVAALGLSRVVVGALRPDRIDLAWSAFAGAMLGLWSRARALQSGRLRDYALALAIGAAGLILLAWGTTWR